MVNFSKVFVLAEECLGLRCVAVMFPMAAPGHPVALLDNLCGTKEPEHRVWVRFYCALCRQTAACQVFAAYNLCSS